MNSGFLNDLVAAFIAATDAGFGVLAGWSSALLYMFGGLAWLASWSGMFMSGTLSGVAMAHLVFLLLLINIHWYVIQNIQMLANAVFSLFARFGSMVSGGAFPESAFLQPSSLVDAAFITARPVLDFITGFSGMAIVWNLHMILLYMLVLLVILAAFFWVVKDVIVTIIEFHFAVMAAPILLPWGILGPTQELASFSISWLLGVSIRMFLISATLGIGVPLFSAIVPDLTAGGDATLYSAAVLALSTGIFAILANQVPLRATAIAGRGMALALPGAALIPGGAIGMAARGIAAVGAGAVRSMSRTLAARRAS